MAAAGAALCSLLVMRGARCACDLDLLRPLSGAAGGGRAAEAATKRAPVRVRASVQPTFVRFVFELPEGASVSSALNEQKLALVFNTALTFDLADARLAAPSNVASISQKIEGDNASVDVALIGEVD